MTVSTEFCWYIPAIKRLKSNNTVRCRHELTPQRNLWQFKSFTVTLLRIALIAQLANTIKPSCHVLGKQVLERDMPKISNTVHWFLLTSNYVPPVANQSGCLSWCASRSVHLELT